MVWSAKGDADAGGAAKKPKEAALPASAVPAVTEAAPVPRKAAAESMQSKHVLVCDDDPLITDLLEHKLSARGYRVTVASNGEEALACMVEQRPDAILLDAMMPMMDGYEVLRRIRQEEAIAKVPVIMLTARKQEQDIVGALELGANDFLVKPFIPEELLSRLARLMPA